MNNSLIVENVSLSLEERPNGAPLKEREAELIAILEAIRVIQGSNEWSTLKIKVFDSLTTNLEKDLGSEAKKESPDTNKLNRLAGQLKWAERYSDLTKLEQAFRTELTHIRLKLHGTTIQENS